MRSVVERERLAEYREAYPELNMKEVARGLRHGPRRATWFNEHGVEIGSGRIYWIETRFELFYDFDVLYGTPAENGRREFHTDVVYHGSHSPRLYALCRQCGMYRSRLFLRIGEWECHLCHSLVNRSKFLSSVQRWTEELAQLRVEVGPGRPFRMREEKYQLAHARMEELKVKLAGRREMPDVSFLRRVHAEWRDDGSSR